MGDLPPPKWAQLLEVVLKLPGVSGVILNWPVVRGSNCSMARGLHGNVHSKIHVAIMDPHPQIVVEVWLRPNYTHTGARQQLAEVSGWWSCSAQQCNDYLMAGGSGLWRSTSPCDGHCDWAWQLPTWLGWFIICRKANMAPK